ncbi:MAG: DUF3703 domain-containing protein [Sphingobium sp.]
MKATRSERQAFLRTEYAAYREARDVDDFTVAWQHLERAHIVAQALLSAHLRSHWMMLRQAIRDRDLVEGAGQLLRLLLVVPGNLTGRLPAGNSGRARASAFRPMPVPLDLERFVQ